MRLHEVTFSVPSLSDESEYEITCEFNVTSWGTSDSYWSPGDPPEWEVHKIWIDEELVPEWTGDIEIHIDIIQVGHWDQGGFVHERPPYGRFREVKLGSPAWEALAASCDTYISENFDFSPDLDWED